MAKTEQKHWKNWRKTKKGLMLNIPILSEGDKGLPLKLFFQRLRTRDNRDVIAMKVCHYEYIPVEAKFEVKFHNAVKWFSPEELKQFAKALASL